MRGADRGVRQELLDEVPVRHGVDRVVERTPEPETGGRGDGVEPQRRRGERARPERRRGRPHGPLVEPLEVAEERPGVGQQVMAERDGLRGPRVGDAGHDRVDVLARPGDERAHEHRGQALDPAARREEPQPQVGDDEVVAAPAGVQPRPHVAQPVRDPAFDRRVHVLVRLIEREPSLGDPAADVASAPPRARRPRPTSADPRPRARARARSTPRCRAAPDERRTARSGRAGWPPAPAPT